MSCVIGCLPGLWSEIQNHQLTSRIISCHWASLGVIGCHRSYLIVCHRKSLVAIGYHWESSGIIVCHRAGVIRHHWVYTSVIGCHLVSSDVIGFCMSLNLTFNRGESKYHGGLQSRELCQAPIMQALSSHSRV